MKTLTKREGIELGEPVVAAMAPANIREGYAMGYAVSDSGDVLGPWRQSEAPIYDCDGGHGMLFRDFGGRLLMTLHQPNKSPDERPFWLEVAEQEGGLALG